MPSDATAPRGPERAPPRTAVFDLDGTLVETAPDLAGAAAEVLAEEGLPFPELAAARSIAGLGGRALLRFGFERAGRPLTDAELERRVPRFLCLYALRIDRESRAYPGAHALLESLRAEGWRLAVCTNKPHGLALTLLDRLGLTPLVDAVRGADVVLGPDSRPVRKPDPRHYWAAVAAAEGAPARSVMIGDSATDRNVARAAGRPVALTRFGYSPDPVESLNPDALVDALSELPAHLERLARA